VRRRFLLLPLVVSLLGACSPAASDTDGEVLVPGPMAPAGDKHGDAVPVVVDTDLAPDDLAALALLVRHPSVEVVAVTVPKTGMVACTGLLGDLFAQLDHDPPPVACGTTARGEEGIAFPPQWTLAATTTSGLRLDGPTRDLAPVRRSSARLIASLARRHDGLQVVALGPLTDVAAVLRDHPDDYARLDGITVMGGAVASASYAEGIAEWNVAADPVPFAEVLAGPVPVTVVPDDAVPPGAPDGLAGPVVGGLGRAPDFTSPAYWDLATAGIFVHPSAATTETGAWEVDTTEDRGRLRRTGDGGVRVVTGLDEDALDEVYRSVFR
jgi:inosine-uridine nucleoside N-ribohydrolase